MNAPVPPAGVVAAPWYRAVRDEVTVFEHAAAAGLPVLLKGPTGCGKSRFVESMAHALGRPLVQVACHDETSATDLLGRWLVKGGDTVWQDGPVTRAVREGAILYLDEIAEAREDVIVVLHPLTDHRRELHLDRLGTTLKVPEGFLVVVSYNPGYQRGLKQLKPSTRQRFVAIDFHYPPPEVEAEVIARESGAELTVAKKLVGLGRKIRALQELGLGETVSTRLLVDAGVLIRRGLQPRLACDAAVVLPLTDDADAVAALRDLVSLHL